MFFSSHRSGRRTRKTRKYDIITTPAERVEMAPLNEENDYEDDSTLYDVKYRFEVFKMTSPLRSAWHQTHLIFTFVPFKGPRRCSHHYWRPVFVHAVLTLGLNPFRRFYCLLTHKHFPKGRRCPVYLHSNICCGTLDQILQSDSRFCRFSRAGELDVDDSSVPARQLQRWQRPLRLPTLLVHGFFLLKHLL